MNWASLRLWADFERESLLECLAAALVRLVNSPEITQESDELTISRAFRRILARTRREFELAWTLQPEASSFLDDDIRPAGHPDFRFSGIGPDFQQFDFDIECKVIRPRRPNKSWDYCSQYVINGIERFTTGVYGQSVPPLGAMIGYVQAGTPEDLLIAINTSAARRTLPPLQLQGNFTPMAVSFLVHRLLRSSSSMDLTHLWVDLRKESQLELLS